MLSFYLFIKIMDLNIISYVSKAKNQLLMFLELTKQLAGFSFIHLMMVFIEKYILYYFI
jgi:hypothetical protein